MEKAKELLGTMGIQDDLRAFYFGLFLGYIAAMAHAETFSMQFTGERSDWVRSFFEEKMRVSGKSPDPLIFPDGLTEDQIKAILEFHLKNIKAIHALG